MNRETMRALFDAVTAIVVGVDAAGRVILFNRAAEDAYRVRAADVLGRPINAPPALDTLRTIFAQGIRARDEASPTTTLPSGVAAAARYVAGEDGTHWLVLHPEAPPQPTLASNHVKESIHSLKTPLTVAKSSLDILSDFDNLDGTQHQLIDRTQENIAHMRATIDKLLYTSWLETSGPLDLAPADLYALVQRQVTDLTPEAQRLGVTLAVTSDIPGCTVAADATQLEEAIGNLLSNAIKYSPAGGQVRVAIEPRGDAVTLRVQDEGLGIAQEHLPHIFEQFYRVHTPQTRRIKGSGLGLSIVKTIVEKHCGTIGVESEPGRGSTFWITLPLRQDAS